MDCFACEIELLAFYSVKERPDLFPFAFGKTCRAGVPSAGSMNEHLDHRMQPDRDGVTHLCECTLQFLLTKEKVGRRLLEQVAATTAKSCAIFLLPRGNVPP